MCLPMTRLRLGTSGLRLLSHRSTTQDSASASDPASTSVSISTGGAAGAVGDGAQAGPAITVYVNKNFFRHYGFHDAYRGGFGGRTIWAHDSGHRLGAPTGTIRSAERFRGTSNASRDWSQGGSGSRVAAAPYANRYAERTGGQGYRSAVPQTQRFRNPPQQTYQAQQQYRSAPQQTRTAAQQYQSAPQQYRSAPQQYGLPQHSRSEPQQSRAAM